MISVTIFLAAKKCYTKNSEIGTNIFKHYLIYYFRGPCTNSPNLYIFIRRGMYQGIISRVYRLYNTVGGVQYSPFSTHSGRPKQS